MAAAYASPPRSAGAGSPKSVADAFQALSQAPPPTIREILGAYSAKGEGDREMLVALLNAKSAEDQRIAAVATLQQTVLQMQHSLALAQAQAAQPSQPHQLPSPRDLPLPSQAQAQPRKRRTSRSPSASPQYAYPRAHPYTRPDHAYVQRSRDERDWAPRRNWASMSSERSTSEEGSERE
ncbi:hypothetical protein CTheo_3506 [Ceratobasidium theobromae]|uniref:Uncharacterized protein n=1 Tax=Ceratobasidium theobromae TaxID=1582974 RepID=A0A5N5QND9_9AGAM|nr:hypothetical protein CTheo_3506 [Ceratobasidium theobromae]